MRLNLATDVCARMWVDCVNMPAPFGGHALKGNPKLAAYCGCFDAAFAERAMKADPKAKAPTADEAVKQEPATRNSCRQEKVASNEVKGFP